MASEYGKEYHRKAESLLSDFLLGLPGLPVEMQNKTSPQFETALSFAMGIQNKPYRFIYIYIYQHLCISLAKFFVVYPLSLSLRSCIT